MSGSLSAQFAKVAARRVNPKPKRRRPSSLSIRVSNEERAYLECMAGRRSIAAYVREKVLCGEQTSRRKVATNPSLDHAMLGQVLGKLRKSDQVACLFLLLAAAESQRVAMAEDGRAALRAACGDVR